jgi:cytochrome c-type biogenesis protein CcmH/NrfF
VAVLIVCAGVWLRGDAVVDRYQRLASKLQCTCGCTQPILKACENMNCEYKASIQNSLAQLAQRAKSNDSDDLILQSFVQEYGPDVLVLPPHSDFGTMAWAMPAIAAALGLLIIVAVVRFWRRRTPVLANVAATRKVSSRTRAEVQAEIERELKEAQ